MKNGQELEASPQRSADKYYEFVLSLFFSHVFLSAMAEDKITFLMKASMASINIQHNPLNHSGNYMYRLL
jgi:hypothetical protein